MNTIHKEPEAGSDCCRGGEKSDSFETIAIRKTEASCGLCEGYVESHRDRPYAIVSCEGACLRGEISRQAANILCHELDPSHTVRVCSGSALTKDSGQRSLLRNAAQVVFLEGCPIACASRSLEAVVPGMDRLIFFTDSLADFDEDLFGIDELEGEKIKAISRAVAEKILAEIPELGIH
jgi:uncharacterized metal-binding protein